MSELAELYQAINTLKKYKIDKRLIEDIVRIEEMIITEQIIPALSDAIDPIISQIKRELLLLIEYNPGSPLQVKITRKRSDYIPEEQDPAFNSKVERKPHRQRGGRIQSPWTGLKVTFPNGKVVWEKYASHTLAKAIEHIGHERVRKLNIRICNVPLVSSAKDDNYGNAQLEIAPRVYVMTHSSTASKKDTLEKVSRRLNLGLRLEIIK